MEVWVVNPKKQILAIHRKNEEPFNYSVEAGPSSHLLPSPLPNVEILVPDVFRLS